MDFSLTDEQQLLKNSVSDFLSNRYALDTSRRAARSGTGWQPQLWKSFAEELGILAAPLPENRGGLGGGAEEVLVISEVLGQHLVVEPFIGTVVLGGGLLRRSNSEVAHDLIGGIAAGDVVTGFAALEPTSGQSFHSVRTTARREGQDWVLDGEKIVVSDAPIATHLIITARTAGDHADTSGLTLFAIPFDPAGPPHGIEAHHYRTIDDHHASDLVMTDLRLPDSARISEVDRAWPVIDAALDEATAATVAEAVGILRKVLADTVEYTKQRRQFGVAISNFQALQHRMVNMHIEVEQAVAASYLASLNLDGPRRTRAVSAAKATIARAARLVGQEAVQLHGGMGMTEELAIGHYFKRLTVIESEFGNRDFHTARYQRARAVHA
ncbi:acyl-CoA dehydrogenase family protein [Mycobacteroides franklinii]|uniref:Acyl-CoA dehydrogenase fadE12 n=1 Tax=Mycobacteroides franklinii TaxID=948102 RepID=A0A4R8R0V6_9MYCO|nr:acyl-CoA dehydrogenase family protein [Mycobacteroides franklinii]ORA58668.1 pimeloyl-CoA dehydrogenase small subunit [Mycobacteroides franklinii]TDH24719.1 pimeloyl-CoA dehydrogenase small subunit [Mycobacteroides franklinii]TDZ45110.1 Acyl-CoA dehydrogenase fadE12 [Mycobacteroides franklinii]TDZ48600.1 Acyl-CoA dehydrogenase fadE12 [Mycobacteroides franklinii]TDZ58780.1 Acyl-CoA dehydrogenase fadE12 [Mycobacteroides franklinii]